MITWLDPRLWLFAIALAVSSFYVGKYDEYKTWKTETRVANATAKEKLDSATKRADEADAYITQVRKETKNESDKQIAANNKQRDAVIIQLRTRLTRRTNASSETAGTSGQCAGASGRELSKPDAGFLARFATEADQRVIELNTCNKEADAVADKINSLSTEAR